MLSTQFTKTFPGAPDGDYALLVFRTSFAKKIDSRETVTLEHEADGAWRVIGYFITLKRSSRRVSSQARIACPSRESRYHRRPWRKN